MKKSFVLIGALSIFSLVGCEETKSVDWWLEHHEESLKKEAECKKTGSDSLILTRHFRTAFVS